MIQLIKNITILFFLLLSLSVSACSKDDFTPAYPKSEGVTRLVSYNVGVFAKYAKSGSKMTARMMKELDADAVGMQELDSCTTRTKHVFQVKRFAEQNALMIVNNATEKLSLFELSEKGGEYRFEKEGEEVKQLAKN